MMERLYLHNKMMITAPYNIYRDMELPDEYDRNISVFNDKGV